MHAPVASLRQNLHAAIYHARVDQIHAWFVKWSWNYQAPNLDPSFPSLGEHSKPKKTNKPSFSHYYSLAQLTRIVRRCHSDPTHGFVGVTKPSFAVPFFSSLLLVLLMPWWLCSAQGDTKGQLGKHCIVLHEVQSDTSLDSFELPGYSSDPMKC